MFFRKIANHKMLMQRVLAIQTNRYCTNKKNPPEPTMAVPRLPSDSVPKAPKVVAKNPPIEELTKGRVFDVKTQTYRISLDPVARYLETDNKKILPEKHEAASDKESNVVPQGTSGSGEDSPRPVPRLIRVEPEKVFFCIVPNSWVKAFNPKTGITGFWTFAFTYGTYLLSKEKIVMEHEYYGALSHIVLWGLVAVYIGPSIALNIDKKVDEIEDNFNQSRIDEKQFIEDSIVHEEQLQLSSAEQLVLVEAKRECVDLQLEAEYRMRQMMVYKRVKDTLDYQVAYDLVERKYAQDQMVRWTMEKVNQAITDEIDSQYVDMCLMQLEELSQKQEAINN